MPWCAGASITPSTYTVPFNRLAKGLIETWDFTSVFSFTLEGSYSSYCGGVEYILDLSPISQSPTAYLTYDGSFILTNAPITTHSDLRVQHILRARVVNWPTDVYQDFPFYIEIYTCDVTGHYVSELDSANISWPSNGALSYTYIAGYSAVIFPF